MMIMSTFGGLIVKKGQKDATRTIKEGNTTKHVPFKYHKPFANHFQVRHAVDNHNHLRHGDFSISIEDTWATKCWENRVFAFLVAISEVNTFLAYCYFV